MPCCSARSADRNGIALPFDKKPERGLLRLRKDLELFANLRPALCFDALKDASSLKPEIVAGLDILIVRELTGGVYFGEPKEITDLAGWPEARRRYAGLYDARDRAHRARGVRAGAAARQARASRRRRSNVMVTGVLWREVVTRVHAKEFPDVAADPCARRQLRHAAGAQSQADTTSS